MTQQTPWCLFLTNVLSFVIFSVSQWEEEDKGCMSSEDSSRGIESLEYDENCRSETVLLWSSTTTMFMS